MSTNNIGGGTPLSFTNCPHWGVGGSYVADPVTGVRTRVDGQPLEKVKQPAEQAAQDEPTAGQVGQFDKPMKEKKHG